MDSLSDVTGSPWFQLVAGLATVLSLILAAAFYRASRRVREPQWMTRSSHLIRFNQSRLPGFVASYRDQEIASLTVTLLVFWNEGREPIRPTDIAPSKPLVILVEGEGEVLSASILTSNSAASKFSLTEVGRATYVLNFDFVSQGDGVVVEIVHTGAGESVSLDGVIIGAALRQVRRVSRLSDIHARMQAAGGLSKVHRVASLAPLLAFLGVIVSSLSIILIFLTIDRMTDGISGDTPYLVAQMVVVVVVLMNYIYMNTSGGRIPRGLEQFLLEDYESRDGRPAGEAAQSDGHHLTP